MIICYKPQHASAYVCRLFVSPSTSQPVAFEFFTSAECVWGNSSQCSTLYSLPQNNRGTFLRGFARPLTPNVIFAPRHSNPLHNDAFVKKQVIILADSFLGFCFCRLIIGKCTLGSVYWGLCVRMFLGKIIQWEKQNKIKESCILLFLNKQWLSGFF